MANETFHDLSTPTILAEKRESLAEAWQNEAGELHGGPVDIFKVLDVARVDFSEWSDEKMGPDEARAYAQTRTIVARPSLFRAAKSGDPLALMKVAHEFAHCVINSGSSPKPLKYGGNAKLAWISESESEEHLAWQLARSLMMPRRFIRDTDGADSVATRFQVPLDQAQKRLAELRLERRKGLQDPCDKPTIQLPHDADRAWRRAAIAEGYHPEWYRLSNGNRLVALDGFCNQKHPLSWTAYNGRIYAKDEWDPSWF